MMGNFFRVTCPYLFQLDTVAYFPLLRGRHSFEAVERIRDTTPDLSPSSESVESLFDKDVPPPFVQPSARGRISV